MEKYVFGDVTDISHQNLCTFFSDQSWCGITLSGIDKIMSTVSQKQGDTYFLEGKRKGEPITKTEDRIANFRYRVYKYIKLKTGQKYIEITFIKGRLF